MSYMPSRLSKTCMALLEVLFDSASGTFSFGMTSLIDVNDLCKSFDVVSFSVHCSG